MYSVAPTIGLHSTSMEELVYDVTLKFETYPRGAGEQNIQDPTIKHINIEIITVRMCLSWTHDKVSGHSQVLNVAVMPGPTTEPKRT